MASTEAPSPDLETLERLRVDAIATILLTRSMAGIWYWNSDNRWYRTSSNGSFAGWILHGVVDEQDLNTSILVLSAEEPTWTPSISHLPKLQLWAEP